MGSRERIVVTTALAGASQRFGFHRIDTGSRVADVRSDVEHVFRPGWTKLDALSWLNAYRELLEVVLAQLRLERRFSFAVVGRGSPALVRLRDVQDCASIGLGSRPRAGAGT